MSTPQQPADQPAPGQPGGPGQPMPQYQQSSYPQAGVSAGGYSPQAPPSPPSPSRPFNIWLVGILGFLAGILDILGGVYLIIERANLRVIIDTQLTPNQLQAAGVAAVIWGIIVLFLTFGVFAGSRVIRFLVALLMVLRLAVSIYLMIIGDSANVRTEAAIHGLIALLILLLIYGGQKTQAFFRGSY